MPSEPDNLVLQLLHEIRAEQMRINDRIATKEDLASTNNCIDTLSRAVAADIHELDVKIDATRKDLSDQIGGLCRAVVEYHSVVICHGNLIADLEARIRRLEQHLGLDGH